MRCFTLVVLTVCLLCAGAYGQGSFVNWENPQIHPLDITPDGNTLLVTHTADSRLEVYDITSGTAVLSVSIPVGLDPVSVRARTNTEAWVVNHISDSVSIVNLATGNVVATLETEDEPCDVVFAGNPERAFVSCSQDNGVLVFDPADLSATAILLPIIGEDPRSLAVSPDGNTVYAAVFESGNNTTILGGGIDNLGAGFYPPNVVNQPAGPYGGQNPPPNDGSGFEPPQNPANPPAPAVGLIVRKDANSSWFDDNGGDWTNLVTGNLAVLSGRPQGWDLVDNDVAVIDTSTLEVSYLNGLMNLCMSVAVNPASGFVSVVGTEATNEIRYEPNVNGRFLQVMVALVDPGAPGAPSIVDLNPHLDYTTPTVDQATRDLSLGDPRDMVWQADGQLAYVSGQGSNNVIVIDASGARSGAVQIIEVGEGPTGLALDEGRDRLYVMNRFAGSISVVDTTTRSELEQIAFFDPTPAAIKTGRKHLYDTHKNSGLGHLACASCHIDSRMDRLAWDLGDPAGDVKDFNQNCLYGQDPTCEDWHPMKGPMTTQTLQDIIGHEPLHWRGDRNGLEEFNGAFIGLQGDDENLTDTEMQEFEDFLATIHFPPNPFRSFDNTLPTSLSLDGHFTTGRFAPAGQPLPNGNAVQGLNRYRNGLLDGIFQCVTCHTLPTGNGADYTFNFGTFQYEPIPVGPDGEHHLAVTGLDGSTNRNIKIPQLRNLYEKVGFDATQLENRAGFGLLHDGSVDSIARFVAEPVFSVTSDQDVANFVAFMLCFSGSDLPEGAVNDFLEPPGTASQDTHAAVGTQLTLDGSNNNNVDVLALFEEIYALADADAVGVVAKGVQNGAARGYAYLGGGLYQSDRASQTISADDLRNAADPGEELTFTLVPKGTEIRIGIDRDEDTFFDRDEIDGCSDPADPLSTPPGPNCEPTFARGDCNDDGTINITDPIFSLDAMFSGGPQPSCVDACDMDDDGSNGLADAIALLAYLFQMGAAPAQPFPDCGADPNADTLSCDFFDHCP